MRESCPYGPGRDPAIPCMGRSYTPRLLIPESYRDRLDEFIKDKDDTDKTLP